MSDFYDQKQLVDSELITIKDVNSFINRRFKTEDGAHYFFYENHWNACKRQRKIAFGNWKS